MNILNKLNNVREGLENKLASFLDNINNNRQLDSVEKAVIKDGTKFLLSKYNIYLGDETTAQLNMISEEIVKCFGIINQKISNQLKK